MAKTELHTQFPGSVPGPRSTFMLGCPIGTEEWFGECIASGDYTDDTLVLFIFLGENYRIPNERNYVLTLMTDGKLHDVRYYSNIVHAANEYSDEYGMDI